MIYTFNPLSQEELDKAARVLTPGRALFNVIDAQQVKAKTTGADMIQLQLEVTDMHNVTATLRDYFVTGSPFGQVKLKHFLEAVGLENCFLTGQIDLDDLVKSHYQGECRLGIKKGEGTYKDSITIKEYFKKSSQGFYAQSPGASSVPPGSVDEFNDDIPF